MSTRQRRVLIVGLPVVALAASIGIVANASKPYRTDGPLQPAGGAGLEYPLPADQALTWGMPLPWNETAAEIRIESIEPVNPRGLDVLGVLARYPSPNEGIGLALGFPPDGVETSPVEGAVLPVRGSRNETLEVLIGVQRHPNAPEEVIEGLRVRYQAGGEKFETVFPWTLRLTAPTD